MSPTRPARLILIGMMGSGKTTIGRLLAVATGWPYIDNDEVLERVAGRTAREIAASGEGAVRAAESEALGVGLTGPESTIVGAAAGTILDKGNRSAMSAAGTVVWLRARPETLARRAGGPTHRPWLDGDALTWFRTATHEREALYAALADVVVDVDELKPEEVATLILIQPALVSSAG